LLNHIDVIISPTQFYMHFSHELRLRREKEQPRLLVARGMFGDLGRKRAADEQKGPESNEYKRPRL